MTILAIAVAQLPPPIIAIGPQLNIGYYRFYLFALIVGYALCSIHSLGRGLCSCLVCRGGGEYMSPGRRCTPNACSACRGAAHGIRCVWERERGCGQGLSLETAAPSPVFLFSRGIAEAACGVGGGMSRPRRLLLPRDTWLYCRCIRLLLPRVTRLCCRCVRLLPYRVTRLCCRCISGTPRPSGSPVRA